MLPRMPLLTLLAAALVAGCGAADIYPAHRTAAITDGVEVDDAYPSVGELLVISEEQGAHLCTATLIGRRTVLTAAHCVHDADSVAFTIGGVQYRSGQVTVHPEYEPGWENNDVAVIALNEEPAVRPTPIATQPPALGTPVVLLGFGITGEGNADGGVKRQAANTIAAVSEMRLGLFETGGDVGNICFGDSGGPSFAVIGGQELQVGVHSHGTKGVPCGVREYDARVDAFSGWIQRVAEGDVALPMSELVAAGAASGDPRLNAGGTAMEGAGDGRSAGQTTYGEIAGRGCAVGSAAGASGAGFGPAVLMLALALFGSRRRRRRAA